MLILSTGAVRAQISPGDLSQPHAELEGLKNCTKCHETGKKISPPKCLDCHTLLQERIRAGLGLHAQPDHRQCADCHSDHHGRDFDMVHWEGGMENFDHDLAGYPLEGAHARVECRDCHQPKYIPNPAPLREKKKDLRRTFLGLDTDCLSCHVDEHRRQFIAACLDCHHMAAWKPAPRFDHDNTNYPLTGKHALVECIQCHPVITDNRFPEDNSFQKFTGIAFARCTDCHEDVHRGRLGPNCESCHHTGSWRMAEPAAFDHDKTRYPLRGMHRRVACEKCHPPGKPLRGLKFARCMDCHSDYHRGQFARRASRGKCEECHTVAGFTPSTFTTKEHRETDFPLEGAHLAVPCFACHKGTPGRRSRSRRSMLEVNRFIFASMKCRDCHKDPHFGAVDKFVAQGGCRYCHRVESWRQSRFDHDQTRFALDGRHGEIRCVACHKPETLPGGKKRIRFDRNVSLLCQKCHEDVHRGQFVTATLFEGRLRPLTDCGRCHTARNWKAERFDHDRDSLFKLEGAHEEVPCGDCHKTVEQEGVAVVIYRPMSRECKSCHGGEAVEITQ
ncbi:MAG: cytochrome C [Calditrichaeota bacterium]|nr:MAG: cytochrome C [Calditrichota bacterium]